jgi:hypothetical protein
VRWEKRGLVYAPPGDQPWARHYAFPPTPLRLDDERLRLYVAFCDADIVGRVGYVDVALDDPGRVLAVSPRPVLDIGAAGMFDENGVLPTCVVPVGDELYLYYVGYQRGARVPYFQFQGLAVSTDGGESFERAQQVPVIDRSEAEPHNRTSAFVRRHGGVFQMWYVGGGEWTEVDGKPLPTYNMRYLESPDGVRWGDEGAICLDYIDGDEHAFGRPWVFDDDGQLTMLFSVRRRSNDYRLGLARCEDGRWVRRDEEVGIGVSPSGWDSEMIAYGSVVEHGGTAYLFYNGNARGRTGFGYAVRSA